MWEPGPGRIGWQRKRQWREFFRLFKRFTDIDGSAIQESVLLDPDVIEEMSQQKVVQGGRPRIWKHTYEIGLYEMMIEAKVGKPIFKRPLIPGHELRDARNIQKLNDTLASVGVT